MLEKDGPPDKAHFTGPQRFAKMLSRKLEMYLATSVAGVILAIFDLFFSLLSCLVYVVDTYKVLPSGLSDGVDIVSGTFFLLDYILILLAAKKKLAFMFSAAEIVHLLTVLPLFRHVLNPLVSMPVWLVILFSFFKLFRIVRILQLKRLMIMIEGEVQQQVMSIGMTVISIAFVATGLIHLMENDVLLWDSEISPFPPYNIEYGLQWHDVLYLIITTITTVGYGDVSPKTQPGRLVIMLMILAALVLVPRETNKLVAILAMNSVYGRQRYKGSQSTTHIIVSGALREGVVEFFHELFHPDHGTHEMMAVVISQGPPSPEIQSLLRNPRFAHQITYLDGSLMQSKDLERASARTAAAVFLLANKFSVRPTEEDASTILQALSIKRFIFQRTAKDILTCVQLIRPESKKLFLSSTSQDPNARNTNHIVCIEELKMNLLAKSCQCPGLSTLLSNLVCSMGGIEIPARADRWIDEYVSGCGYEIYRVKISPTFKDLTFLQAVSIIHEESGVLLFALELNPSEMKPCIFLNPTNFVLPDPDEYGLYGYVLAEDQHQADILTTRVSNTHLGVISALRESVAGGASRRSSIRSSQSDAWWSGDTKDKTGGARESNSKAGGAKLPDHIGLLRKATTKTLRFSAIQHRISMIKNKAGAGGAVNIFGTDDDSDESDSDEDSSLAERMKASYIHPSATDPAPPETHAALEPALSVPSLVAKESTGPLPGLKPNRLPPIKRSPMLKASTTPDMHPEAIDSGVSSASMIGKVPAKLSSKSKTKGNVEKAGKPGAEASESPSASSIPESPVVKKKWGVAKKKLIIESRTEAASETNGYYVLPEPMTLKSVTIDHMATDLPGVKDHIIVIGDASSLLNFIVPLRSRSLRTITPIVILHPQVPNKTMWQRIASFERIYFVRGSSLDTVSLRRAGIGYASKVVILARTKAGREGDMETAVDADTIFAYRVSSQENPNVHIICDIVSQSNTLYLLDAEDHDTHALTANQYLSPIYASGNTFTSSLLDTLMCQAFYNPHIITILNMLVTEGNSAEEASWNDKIYARLGSRISGSSLTQISVPRKLRGKSYRELLDYIIRKKKAVPIGLLRGVSDVNNLRNKLPYVYTNPSGDAIVYEGDTVFVLGSPALEKINTAHLPTKVMTLRTRNYAIRNLTAKDMLLSLNKEVQEGVKKLGQDIYGMESRLVGMEGHLVDTMT